LRMSCSGTSAPLEQRASARRRASRGSNPIPTNSWARQAEKLACVTSAVPRSAIPHLLPRIPLYAGCCARA
jgi:hypothetical protein